MKKIKNFKSFNESKQEGILFGDNIETVIEQLLTLNSKEGFEVSKIDDNKVKIIYTGGYNNVYHNESRVFIDFHENIHDKWYYWKFTVVSDEHTDSFETAELSGTSSGDFVDFFIDMYIRYIGIMAASNEEF